MKRLFVLLVVMVSPALAANPVRIAWKTNGGGLADVRCDWDRRLCYAASPSSCMSVWDIGNPSDPALRGWSSEGCAGNRIDQEGAAVVVAAQGSGGLLIFDVTSPSQPVVRGRLSGSYRQVAIGDGKVYGLEVVAGNPATVSVRMVDLSGRQLASVVVPNDDYTDMARCGGKVYLLSRRGRVVRIDVMQQDMLVGREAFLPTTTASGSPSPCPAGAICSTATQMACAPGGGPIVGRLRSTADKPSPWLNVVETLDGQTLSVTYTQFMSGEGVIAIGQSALWQDGEFVYGGTTPNIGRYSRLTPKEWTTGYATAVVGRGDLMVAVYPSVDLAVKKTGGLMVYSFSANIPTAVPTQASTGTPVATSTVAPTMTPAVRPTCPSGCVVP